MAAQDTGGEVAEFVSQVKDEFVAEPRDEASSGAGSHRRRGERMARRLKKAMDERNVEQFYLRLGAVLNKNHFPAESFRHLVEAYGGKEKLILEVRQFLRFYGDPQRTEEMTRIMRSIPIQIERRLNNDQPLPGEHDVYKLKQELESAAMAAEGALFLGRVASGLIILEPVKNWLDEVLGTAKKHWSRVAEGYADAGDPVTATIIQTLNDLFMPGSAFELGISAVPVGRGGGVALVAYKRAGKEVFEQLIRKGLAKQNAKVLRAEVDKAMELVLKSADPDIAALVKKGTAGDREALIKLSLFENLVNEVTPLYRTSMVKEAKATLRQAARRLQPDLDNYLQLPPKSSAQQSLTFLKSGRVNQVIEAPFVKRPGKRVADAQKTAERIGLVSVSDQHWSHLIPDVQSGDDAVFNLIRASDRINVSFMKLIDKLEVPKGATVRIEVLFDNAIDAYNRHAQEVVYHIVKDGKVIERIPFLDPVQTPLLTQKQLRTLAEQVLKWLAESPDLDWKLVAIQKIVDFLLIGKGE